MLNTNCPYYMNGCEEEYDCSGCTGYDAPTNAIDDIDLYNKYGDLS